MKSPILSSIFLLLALGGLASADLPVKAPLNRYSGLWNNSPFTAKPPPTAAGPENNPLDDYALIGVTSLDEKQGYRVSLINKKTPDKRIIVDSGTVKEGFSILNVTRKPGDPLGTVVSMMSGSLKGTVSFDEKLLTLVTAAPPKAAPPQPGQPVQPGQANPNPQPNPPQNPNGQPPQGRQPRPRVVPPPNPQGAGQPQQGQQGQQGQPNQGRGSQNNQGMRPQRRGN